MPPKGRGGFQRVDQTVSLSDVVVSPSDDNRDSLGEGELDGFTNYQKQNQNKEKNKLKICCCGIIIFIIVISVFIIVLAIASRNTPRKGAWPMWPKTGDD